MKYAPKISQLNIFQAIIKYGSIRAASRALNQSQPALTRALKELESNLGVTLIIRGPQGIQLTEEGQLFSIRVGVILQELQKAREELQYSKDLAGGTLRLGCSSLILLTIFPKVLDEFKRLHPKTKIHLEEGQISALLPKIRENKLDFVIGSISENLPLYEFVESPLFTASFTILCRKGHPLENCTDVGEIKKAKWLIPAADMGYYHQLNGVMKELYEDLSITPIFTDSVTCGLNLVLNGDYLIIIAKAMAKPLSLGDELSEIKLKFPLPEANYHLIHSRNTPLLPPAQQMIKLFQWFADETDWNQLYSK